MALFYIFIFPGVLFMGVYTLFMVFLDRKMYARMQNRQGPRWYQPLADFIKLLGKETIIPESADKHFFPVLPAIAFAAVVTAFLYVPIWTFSSLMPFEGDLILVLYLLMLPTLCMFLGGWYSTSLYASIGSNRVLTQLFAYEVPLFLALLAPALLADTWSITGITQYYYAHPLYLLINIPAFLVAIVTSQGKLERVPFDSPGAETEVVDGPLVEYGGRLFAIFRMALDSELMVICSLIAAIFLPFFVGIPVVDFLLYIVKTLVVLFIFSLMRTVMARLRIDQMVAFCWKALVPIALIQMVVNILLKGVLA